MCDIRGNYVEPVCSCVIIIIIKNVVATEPSRRFRYFAATEPSRYGQTLHMVPYSVPFALDIFYCVFRVRVSSRVRVSFSFIFCIFPFHRYVKRPKN